MTPDQRAAQTNDADSRKDESADRRNALHYALQYALSRRGACELSLLAFALLLRLWTPAPSWVEQYYANGFYPFWDSVVRSVTERVPFSVGDVLALGLTALFAAVWLGALRRAARERSMHAFLKPLLGSGAACALLFISFLFSWAYNYARVPVKEKLLLHPERTDAAAVAALGERTVRMLNANVAGAHAARYSEKEMQRRLAPTFFAVTARLGDRAEFPPAPIKPTLFEAFMHAGATYGFTDPWTHEINLSSTLLPVERAATYAHEWSHLAGFADESEANFIAVLSCLASSDPALRYSGWLLVWFNLPSSLHVHQRALPAVIGDIKEIVLRYHREVKPRLAHAQQIAYDAYLRANAVRAGFESYHLFIQLLTAGELDANGLPVVKAKWQGRGR